METIHAAICEDEEPILKHIYSSLKNSFSESSYDISFDCYLSGNKLLNAFSSGKDYQLLFLDIEMPGVNGIDLCKKLRSLHNDAIIVFISNREELVFQSFEVRPFAFVRKNHFADELPALVKNLEHTWNSTVQNMITLKEQHSCKLYSFNVNEIIYVEALLKTCRIITTHSEEVICSRLSDLETELQEFGFLKIHRSYLVNYRYIYCIKKEEILLLNHIKLPLSRRRIPEIKQQFIELSQGGTL